MNRKEFLSDMTLIIEDVMGETPLDNPKLKSVIEEVNSKIGWGAIKKAIQEMLKLCETNYKRELLGKTFIEIHRNVFDCPIFFY
jgi:hypothetical protein